MPFGFKAPSMNRKKNRGAEIDEMMDYLKGGGSLAIGIQKRFELLPEKYSVLLLAKQDKYDLLLMNVVKHFCKKKMGGIIVTLNKPGEDLISLLTEHKVPCTGLFIVDGISKKREHELAQDSRIAYIDTPQDLTDMEANVIDFIQKLPPGKKFFILDSLSTLMIYNAEKTVERFVHRIGERLRSSGFQSVFLIMDGTRPEIMNVLSQFADAVVKIGPEISP